MKILLRMTSPILLLILSVAGLTPSPAAAQSHFAFTYGSLNLQTRGVANVVDAEGNYINGGVFTSWISPDPFGNTSLSSTGDESTDVVLAKYAPHGALLWAKKFGGTLDDYLNDVGCDSMGNVYASGLFRGTIEFDGKKMFSKGSYDGYFAKYAPDGSYLWAITIGTAKRGGDEQFGTMAIDAAGNVYITGSFHGMVDLNPLGQPSPRGSADTGSRSRFLAKYDGDGILAWAAVVTADPTLTTDGTFNFPVIDGDALYVVTSVLGPDININPLGDPTLLSGNETAHHYLAEYHASDGSLSRFHQIGGAVGFTIKDLAFDGSATLAVSGTMSILTTVDFDPTSAVSLVDSSTVFLALYGTDGALRYAFGLNGNIVVSGTTLDAEGNAYLSGSLGRIPATDIDPDPERTVLRQREINSGTDSFIAKYDANGRLLWDHHFGGSMGNAQSIVNDVAIGRDDDLYITGLLSGYGADVDPGPDTLLLSGAELETHSDLYIVKYTADGALWRSGTTGVAEDRSGDGAILRLLLR